MDSYAQETRRHDPYGYARHIAAGALIGVGVSSGMLLLGFSGQAAGTSGLAAAAVIGAAKEFRDSATGGGVMDWLDAAFTALGGLAAFLALLVRP